MGEMLWIWIAVIVMAVILEASSPVQLVSIWAAPGGAVGLILHFCQAPVWVQVVAFVTVTFLLILLTRPLARKMTKFNKTATNADHNIGKSGMVTKITDEANGTFRVKVGNEDWAAMTEDQKPLPVGTAVSILRIEGVKLIVTPEKLPEPAQVK